MRWCSSAFLGAHKQREQREERQQVRGKNQGARASPGAWSRTGEEAGDGGETWPRPSEMRARSSSYWQELEEAPAVGLGWLGRNR